MLKLAGPWDRTADEIACLRLWRGGPAPALLEADEERSAILLERVTPGTRETDADPESIASLLEEIHVPDELGLRALDVTATRRLDRAERDGRASGQRLAWARTAVQRLQEDAPAAVIVHGDFDERNLLTCARRGVCAIDPLPCAGDGTYDAAYWVHANRRRGRRGRFDAMVAARVRAGSAPRLVRRRRSARLSERCKTPFGERPHAPLQRPGGLVPPPHLSR